MQIVGVAGASLFHIGWTTGLLVLQAGNDRVHSNFLGNFALRNVHCSWLGGLFRDFSIYKGVYVVFIWFLSCASRRLFVSSTRTLRICGL